MGYGKRTVYLFTAVLLAAAVFWGVKESQWDGTVSLSVVIASGEGTEETGCWESEAGEYYLFLPSYAELSQVRIRTNTSNDVCLDGQLLTDGMSCESVRLNEPYDLTYMAGGRAYHFPLVFIQSTNVSTLYIDVPSGSMDYIHEEKGNEEPGTMRLYTAEGILDYRGNLESINGRGNATWDTAKKPYSLKLSREADLLGMGQAQKWILLANAYDRSHMRNKMVFDYADAVGLAYSPDSAWVDLYLNGEYAGLYLLCERNEVHPQRIPLTEDGSFLVSMDVAFRLAGQSLPFISTAAGVDLRIQYSSISADELKETWQSAENAILREDGIDPDTGKSWQELIDLDSWAKKYLIEEIFGNTDAGCGSQFFYRDGTGKIYAGPVWDYDMAMGKESEWQIKAPNTILAGRPHLWREDDTPWFYALLQKDVFRERVTELYQTLFQPLLAELLDAGMDRYAAQISQAAAANQLRWSDEDMNTHVEKIRTYMTARMDFLNSLWIEQERYCFVQVNNRMGDSFGCFAVRPGELLPEVPEYKSNEQIVFYGWYVFDTDEPFDVTQPVYEDEMIYLKLSYIQ